MRCVPGGFETSGNRVGIAVVIDPLAADLPPKRVIIGTGNARLFVEHQWSLDANPSHFQKCCAEQSGRLRQQFGSCNKEEWPGIARTWVVQVEEQVESPGTGQILQAFLGGSNFWMNGLCVPIAIVVTRSRFLAAVACCDIVDIHDRHDEDF